VTPLTVIRTTVAGLLTGHLTRIHPISHGLVGTHGRRPCEICRGIRTYRRYWHYRHSRDFGYFHSRKAHKALHNLRLPHGSKRGGAPQPITLTSHKPAFCASRWRRALRRSRGSEPDFGGRQQTPPTRGKQMQHDNFL